MKIIFGKSLLVLVLTCSSVFGDRTFIWSGDDPRFSGWFSISEADYQRRAFETITAARYQFNDSTTPSLSVVLEDPRGFHGGNTEGRLTADGRAMSHEPLPWNENVSFWVAVWQPPGIDVGMYGWYDVRTGKPEEYFEYYHDGTYFRSLGTWTLVPEPSSITLLLVGVSLGLFFLKRKTAVK